MELNTDLVPVILTNLITAAVLAGIIWNRLSNIEAQTEKLWRKIDNQNGRVDELEQWRSEREGWRRGWRDRKQREEGPQND